MLVSFVSSRLGQHLMFIGLALSAVGMVALHQTHTNALPTTLTHFEDGTSLLPELTTPAHHYPVNSASVSGVGGVASRSMLAVSSVGSTTNIGSWKNQHNVVHVVSTRFQQYQAHLLHLAEARLEMFKAFTLPSMKQQSQKEFLWMIWTDPELDAKFRGKLVDLVQGLPNVVVVANEAVKDTTLRELYGHTMSSLGSSVVHGDLSMLSNYRAASQSHLLLETQLDADDALSETFVDLVQTQAADKLGQYVDRTASMEIICPFKHMEFRDYDFQLIDYKNADFCIGSGTTTVLHLEGNTRKLTQQGHCIYNELPVCKDLRPPSTNIFDHHPSLLRRRLTTDQQCLADRYIQEEELHIHDNSLELHSDSAPLPHVHICPGKSMLCRTEHTDGSGLEDHFWESAWYPGGLATGDRTQLICYPEGCESTAVLAFDVEIGELNTNGDVVQVHVELAGWTGDEAWAITKGYTQFGTTGLEFCWEDDLPFGHTLCGDEVALGGSFYGNFHSGLHRAAVNHLDICVEPTFCWPEEERICRRRLKHAVRKTVSSMAVDEGGDQQVLVNEGASVFLARTITAHGFKHVLPSSDPGTNSVALSTFDHAQDEAWDYVKNVFNISKASAYHVSSYIQEHKEDILVDAFNGQCTSGHSCKQSTKRALGKMLNEVHKN